MSFSTPNQSRIFHYLDSRQPNSIRDPLWGHIYLDDPMLKLVNSPPLQQLTRIKQLGPSFLVYPGATHTRLNHSLGVLQIARKMLRNLLSYPGAPEVSLEGAKAFLCAALLHDVGHFPYTHALKELPLVEHEQLTAKHILSEPIKAILENDIEINAEAAAAIVDSSFVGPVTGEILFFRHLLSSALDPDKLDYLNRDAYFCGVPYGVQDTDYVLDQIRPHPEFGVGILESGISALENLLFSKYLMYRAVYWHRTVRIATGMIKKGLYLGLDSGKIIAEELYDLDDESFYSLCRNNEEPEFQLIQSVHRREFFQTVCEIPFNPDFPHHSAMTALPDRTETEKKIADFLASELNRPVPEEFILIDIPENISFEINMHILSSKGWRPYAETRTVFTPQVIKDFTAALRLVRLALHPSLTPLKTSSIQKLTRLLNHGMD
ncbi:HD domain-containing protein [Spirochaeta dissipatitropha]